MASILEIRDVSLSFGGLAALAHVSAAVQQGECLGIIGSNGAGKSTLTNVICGALRADSGEVVLDSAVLPPEGPRERARRGLSRTFQAAPIQTSPSACTAPAQPGLQSPQKGRVFQPERMAVPGPKKPRPTIGSSYR